MLGFGEGKVRGVEGRGAACALEVGKVEAEVEGEAVSFEGWEGGGGEVEDGEVVAVEGGGVV